MPVTQRKDGKKKITEHWRSEKHMEAYALVEKAVQALGELEVDLPKVFPKKQQGKARTEISEVCGRASGLLQSIVTNNWDVLDDAPIAAGLEPWDVVEKT